MSVASSLPKNTLRIAHVEVKVIEVSLGGKARQERRRDAS